MFVVIILFFMLGWMERLRRRVIVCFLVLGLVLLCKIDMIVGIVFFVVMYFWFNEFFFVSDCSLRVVFCLVFMWFVLVFKLVIYLLIC